MKILLVLFILWATPSYAMDRMDCQLMNTMRNVHRCENSEAVCYSRANGGITCKFK